MPFVYAMTVVGHHPILSAFPIVFLYIFTKVLYDL